MKTRTILLLLLLAPLLVQGQHVEASWESINQRGYPEWFTDARLGIFIHWGLYSVPAYAGKEGYSEWFYRGLMTGDPERRRIMSLYADTTLPLFEQYRDLADHWHGELWNPDEWARLFRKSGARYVVLVTKHHDGYCLWDSPQQPEWNSTVSGPRRNIVEELTEAVRREGLRMGFYYSLPEWTNPLHIWMKDPDKNISDYVEKYMIPQFKELVSRYRPDLIFSDGDWQNTAKQFHSEELISWYYNTVGADAIVNNRWGQGTQHGFKTPEYSAGIVEHNIPWAECRGIGRSFGYNRNEDIANFMTDRELIQHFCELVANGGGLTLNVGPMADGTIPFIQQERLLALGRWLSVNGEAIYGSEPSHNGWRDEHTVRPVMTVQHVHAELPESNTIDFDWVRNAPLKEMPVDNFSLCWQGIVTAPEKGDYTLVLEADDEAYVVLKGKDDTILYYNHGWAENARGRKTLHLKKGERLDLEVSYKEKELEAAISLKWSSDGVNFEPVPAKWHGTTTWHKTVNCFTQRNNALYVIEFNRPEQTLELFLPELPENAVATLLGTSATLTWSQRFDKVSSSNIVTIDLSSIDQQEMNALDHAWVIKIDNYSE